MQLKKLYFILPSISGGGAERVVTSLINSLDTNKYLITLILLTPSRNKEYFVNTKNIIRLNKKRTLYSALELYRIIKRDKPDIVFTTLTYLNCFYGILHFLFFSKSVFWICRESSIPSYLNAGWFVKRLYRFLITFTYKRADKIVCQSNDMMIDLKSIYDFNNITLINNPVFTSEKLNELKTKSDFPVFVTIAMLRKEKGIERILEAIYLSSLKDFAYIIIGQGSTEQFLRQTAIGYGIADKVIFKGYSNKPWDMIDYDSSIVFLQGSYYEGFPNVLIEAASRGYPILAYDCVGGTREIVKNGFNGFLVNTVQDFADKLSVIHEYRFESKKIQDDIMERFSLDVIVKKYDDLFSEFK